MPVVLRGGSFAFPDPAQVSSPEGLVAIGGDAHPERLAAAYAAGIFPWPHEGFPLLWFSPDPRFVLDLNKVHVPRRLGRTIGRTELVVTMDRDFRQVMAGCSSIPRPGQEGTWITDELRDGYLALHQAGLAHSVEAWRGGTLVGGLYGVSLGSAFFGDSMFSRESDASKVAFITLLGHLAAWGFSLVDCQVQTDHLARFGARDIPRVEFKKLLVAALETPHRRGPWRAEFSGREALNQIRKISE